MVSDGGGNEQTATVTISIADTNDNAPIFEEEIYYGEVLENDGNTAVTTGDSDTVLTLHATDADADTTYLTYTIASSYVRRRLSIETISPDDNVTFYATLTTNDAGLDRETDPTLEFEVYVEDSGGLTGTATVVLDIIGVNDNNPYFSSQFFSFEVADDATVGTIIGQVIANDIDIPNEGNVCLLMYRYQNEF